MVNELKSLVLAERSLQLFNFQTIAKTLTQPNVDKRIFIYMLLKMEPYFTGSFQVALSVFKKEKIVNHISNNGFLSEVDSGTPASWLIFSGDIIFSKGR